MKDNPIGHFASPFVRMFVFILTKHMFVVKEIDSPNYYRKVAVLAGLLK